MNPLANPSYLLPPIFAFTSSSILCLVVARQARGNAAHLFFALFLLAISAWSFLVFVMRASPDSQHAMFWENVLLPVMLTASPSFYFFTCSYTRVQRPRISSLVGVLYLVIAAFLGFQGMLVERMELQSYGYTPIFTPLFYPMALIAYVWIGLGIMNLFRAYRASRVYEERNRLLFMVVGTLFPLVGTIVDIFPSVYPTSILGNLAFGVVTTIAMLRYQLLDISLVIRKGLAYLTISILVAFPYVAIIVLATRVLQGTGAQLVVYFVLLVALAMVLQPLWSKAQVVVDKVFFRQRWDSFHALEEFTRRARSIAELEQPAHELVEIIRTAMKADGVSLLLPSENGEFAPVATASMQTVSPLAIPKESPLALWLDREQKPLDLRRLDLDPQLQALGGPDRRALKATGATLLVPLRMRDRLSGVLVLGAKLAETPYSKEELALLSAVATQTAVLLDDARLYRSTRDQLEQGQRRLEAFRTAASKLALEEAPDLALQDLVDTARELIGARRGVLAVLDTDGHTMREFVSGSPPEERFGNAWSPLEPVGVNALNGKTADWHRPTISGVSPFFAPASHASAPEASLAVPISVKGQTRGQLYVTGKGEALEFSQDDERLAGLFSAVAAVLIDNSDLYSTVAREKTTLAAILFSMTEGLVVLGSEGRVAWWNHAMTAFTGIPDHAVLEKSFEEVQQLIAPNLENPQILFSLGKAIANAAEPSRTYGLVLTRPQRRELSARVFSIPIGPAETLVGCMVRDITQERELEERRNAFISIASHELRTPMSSIVGFSEILLRRDVPEKVRRDWLQLIHEDGMRLSGIVDDLLNISRLQSGKFTISVAPLPLRPLLEEMIAHVGPITAHHEVALDIPPHVPEVWADHDKVIQVLTNLLTNAVKYSPAGGLITVRAREESATRRVVVSVADQGIGIAMEDQVHLFQSFQRVSRPETEGVRGAGLGLYIVKSFVELMGGEVWLESALNQGSTFSFSLPTRSPRALELAGVPGGEHDQKSPDR